MSYFDYKMGSVIEVLHCRTWAEEKRNQLAYRLQWITFERAREFLQK
jgi:hypothetical protein